MKRVKLKKHRLPAQHRRQQQVIECLRPTDLSANRDLCVTQALIFPEGEEEFAISLVTARGTITMTLSADLFETLGRKMVRAVTKHRSTSVRVAA